MNGDYRLRTKKLIKWYEYQMKQDIPEEAMPEEMPADNAAAAAPEPVASTGCSEEVTGYDDEGIDLASSGLSEADQDLVASIMAKFADAKQNSVDDVFAKANDAIAETAAPPAEEMSPDDLIASICAPKQSNVDSLVNQARETMPGTS